MYKSNIRNRTSLKSVYLTDERLFIADDRSFSDNTISNKLPGKGIQPEKTKHENKSVMMPNLNKLKPRGLRARFPLSGLKAAPFVLLLLQGNTVLAQVKQAASSTPATGEKITAGEILLYIALIVGVILIAWFFGAGQSKSDVHHPEVGGGGTHRRHYDHPNDPHFRRLKKKTS